MGMRNLIEYSDNYSETLGSYTDKSTHLFMT